LIINWRSQFFITQPLDILYDTIVPRPDQGETGGKVLRAERRERERKRARKRESVNMLRDKIKLENR